MVADDSGLTSCNEVFLLCMCCGSVYVGENMENGGICKTIGLGHHGLRPQKALSSEATTLRRLFEKIVQL